MACRTFVTCRGSVPFELSRQTLRFVVPSRNGQMKTIEPSSRQTSGISGGESASDTKTDRSWPSAVRTTSSLARG
jgi:hypothetical protein